jgi:HlyD family secretion protein
MNERQRVWLGILLIIVIGSAAGCNLHGRPTVERKQRPVTSVARPVTAGTEAAEGDAVVAPGIVESWGDQVDLSAQEAGWISQIVVMEGAAVRAGDPLATLEDAAHRHAMDLALADLAEAQAALARIEHGATAEELRQAQADVDAASARSGLARATAARTIRLYADGVVAVAEQERAEADAWAQSALAERADARLAEVRRGARPEDRNAARARLETAQARVRVAEDNLSRRRVIAPAAGTILLSRFHAGEFYAVGAGPLFVLGDVSRLQIRLEVDEIDALDVRPGAACRLYSDGGARIADGRVVRLAPKMGRRGLALESPTARADIRVREVFVEVAATSELIPGQRVWGHAARDTKGKDARRPS